MEFLDISFTEEEVTTKADPLTDVNNNDIIQAPSLEFQATSAEPQVSSSEPSVPSSEPQASTSSDPKRRPSRLLSCNVCRYSTYSRGNLYRHKQCVHAKVKKRCTICLKQFSQAYDLSQHRKSVHENIKLMCEVCSKTFNNRFTLRRHRLLTHTGEVKHECKMCGKKFFDKNSYFGHINNHVKAKPYCCTVCNKAFAYKNSLQRHSVVCAGNRDDPDKYKCSLCDKKMKSRASLQSHTKGVHGVKDQFCRCGKSFSWPSSLSRHQKKCKVIQ